MTQIRNKQLEWANQVEISLAQRVGEPSAAEYDDATNAANILLEEKSSYAEDTFGRIEALLNVAAGFPGKDPTYLAWTRARAIIELQAHSTFSKQYVLDVLFETFEQIQRLEESGKSLTIALALGNVFVSLKNEEMERRYIASVYGTLRHATTALEEASDDRLALSAYLLAQVGLRAIESGVIPETDAKATYAELHALIKKFIGPIDAQANPGALLLDRAGCYEVAGRIAAADPGPTPDTGLRIAGHFFHEAYLCCKVDGSREDIGRIVTEMLDVHDRMSLPPTTAFASQLEEYLRSLEWAYTGVHAEQLRFAPVLLRLAQTWLLAADQVSGEERASALATASALGLRIATHTDVVGADSYHRACGWFTHGNALVHDDIAVIPLVLLPEDEREPTRQRLEMVLTAFESALRELGENGNRLMLTRVNTQLGKTLTALTIGCGDPTRLDAAKAAWMCAVDTAVGGDLVRCRLNLLLLILSTASANDDAWEWEAPRLITLLERHQPLPGDLEVAFVQARYRYASLRLEAAPQGKALDFNGAIDTAKDPEKRRLYLDQMANSLPSYSSERFHIVHAGYYAVLCDLESMRIAGVPESDPELWKEALFLAEREKVTIAEFVARDRIDNSGDTGKQLLSKHLKEGEQYILVLRSYELEVKTVENSFGDENSDNRGPGQFSRVEWRNVSGQRTLRNIADLILPLAPLLLVVNEDDPIPVKKAAKLFVRGNDWKGLVFSLIAEASAVIVSIPGERGDLTEGVAEELRAIDELNVKQNVIIILETNIALPGLEAPVTAEHPEVDKRKNLGDLGFELVFGSSEILGNPSLIVDPLRKLVGTPIGTENEASSKRNIDLQ
jgi:hypothetical protein